MDCFSQIFNRHLFSSQDHMKSDPIHTVHVVVFGVLNDKFVA